jgi:hypothetical protein
VADCNSLSCTRIFKGCIDQIANDRFTHDRHSPSVNLVASTLIKGLCQLSQTPEQFRFCLPVGPIIQDILGCHFVAQCVGQLLAASDCATR